MRNTSKAFVLSLTSILIGAVLAELLAQIYVEQVAQKGRLFERDTTTGWKVRPYLDMQRKNADGDIWKIVTDEHGIRIPGSGHSGQETIVILGDSFSFGEGVDVQNRYDAALIHQGYWVINTGVMGYSTDQQFLAAAPYLANLQEQDVILIQTYYNDFYDISRKSQFGRSKPWYSMRAGELHLHKATAGIGDFLRDRSIIFAKVASMISEQRPVADTDIAQALAIYTQLLEKHVAQLDGRGVTVILVYHGISDMGNDQHKELVTAGVTAACDIEAVVCLNLDQHINQQLSPNLFLSDGHWNSAGHHKAGQLIAELILQTRSRDRSPRSVPDLRR